MKVVLVNPPMVFQKGDFFSSGIPYFPIGLAYVAAYLREKGHSVKVIDAFGESPSTINHSGNFGVQGLRVEDVLARIDEEADAVFIYCSLVTTHSVATEIAEKVRKVFPRIPVVFLENTQQVFAYSLKVMYPELLKSGDYVIVGEPEERADRLLEVFSGKLAKEDIDGLAYLDDGSPFLQPKTKYFSTEELDALPFPAFDLFPLQNYWNIGYSHGPYSGKYLPIMTSRGCPFACEFCVINSSNERKWRYRSAKSVVDEMEHFGKAFGVFDFHVEDLNPTVSKERIVGMCKDILSRGMKVTWKLVSGTKVETFNAETLEWMKKAGCVYVSISPESGSPRVLELMKKPFDHVHGKAMIKKMDALGIYSQACFVLGFPGETADDLKQTEAYVKELVKNGLDEAAFFMMTPIPGSAVYAKEKPPVERLEQLNFSPEWRPDYKKLHNFRMKLYGKFAMWKARYRPLKFMRNAANLVSRRFDIKAEMTLWRMAKTHLLYGRSKKEGGASQGSGGT
ncbi:B12-binding domain-containing radical SAM protein [Candidatus Micrarchaeota archaeon]|nr:B12-binding domain-containing radical SAM protein [Candidatus Micrarchaeota archaeon]